MPDAEKVRVQQAEVLRKLKSDDPRQKLESEDDQGKVRVQQGEVAKKSEPARKKLEFEDDQGAWKS